MELPILIGCQYKFLHINFLIHNHHPKQNQICFGIMTFPIIVPGIMNNYKLAQSLLLTT